MAETLYIIGAGGHGKVCADTAKATGHYNHIAFLDSQRDIGDAIGEWEVVGRPESFADFADTHSVFFVAIGDNRARRQWLQRLTGEQVGIATLVHPTSIIAEHVHIGAGTLVVAGSIINGFTQIGQGCIINTATSIDHDCSIGDYVHIAPGCHLAGTVTVGEEAFVGIGSAVIPNISIGSHSIIGAGSAVTSNIDGNVVAVGSPARPIRPHHRE
ncbi:acetyltransferase [Aestuariibacter salexigens]|uniref:acetyltransferase n=1 Tax=Aestuariibacter salexigens TaxID=226010 RepID=UPI00040BA6C8|nr:acetyltransferase [Aestuariibacter salexigens]